MALATIVAVRGSTYRRPGARLLVPEDGAPIGNISGGCLEGDVTDMARIVMEEGRARLAGWDLTADDDEVWGLGLGCNGAIEVFIEPADRAAEVAGALRMALEEERPDQRGDGARVRARRRRDRGADRREARRFERGIARGSGRRRRRRARGEGAARGAGIRDPPAPRRRPGVRRGARASAPLADLRRRPRRGPVGEGGCGTRMEPARGRRPAGIPDEGSLPGSGRVRPGRGTGRRREGRDHGRADVRRGHDPQLPPGQGVPPLVPGIPGRLHRDARARGTHATPADGAGGGGREVTDEDRARIHGPAGLDLGSEGPEEIAGSILSEIVAVRRGRHGGFLKERPGPIHDRPKPGTEAK